MRNLRPLDKTPVAQRGRGITRCRVLTDLFRRSEKFSGWFFRRRAFSMFLAINRSSFFRFKRNISQFIANFASCFIKRLSGGILFYKIRFFVLFFFFFFERDMPQGNFFRDFFFFCRVLLSRMLYNFFSVRFGGFFGWKKGYRGKRT